MTRSRFVGRAALGALMLLLGTATALPAAERTSSDGINFNLTATSASAFRAQADRIRTALAPAGRHADLAPADRQRIEHDLARIQAVFDRYPGEATLDERERVLVFNAQEEINAILRADLGGRLVCEYVSSTGSHRKEKVCISAAERDEQRRRHQEALRDSNLRIGGG